MMSGQPTPIEPFEQKPVERPEPTLQDYLTRFWLYRVKIAVVVLIATVTTAVVSLVWPPTYQATTTLLPPTEEGTGFSVSSLMGGLSNIPGITVPGRTGPEDIAVVVLESRRINSAILTRFNLADAYGTSDPDKAMKTLRKRTSFRIDETGVVVISVKDRDPHRASEIANGYVDELDKFNREIRMTKGRRMRMFIEGRLQQENVVLAEAEEKFGEYQRENKAVALSPEQASTVQAGAQLFARQAALHVELGTLREYAAENSEEVFSVRQELEQVERQISELPELGMEMARLMREVRMHIEIVALLTAQYEEARINEARDVATLEVLDTAVAPNKPQWPRKRLLTMIAFMLSLFGAVLWVTYLTRKQSLTA